jgi:iron complex outermembrane receptor protein
LRFARINVPGRKDMDIDDLRLHLKYEVSDDVALDYRFSYQDMTRSQIYDADGGSHAAPEWSSIGEPQTAEQWQTYYYPIWDESWETVSSQYQTTSHELQVSSTGDSRLQYVAGLFYLKEEKQIRYDMEFLNVKTYYEDSSSPFGFNPDGLPDSWVFDQNMRTTESKAAFAQLDYQLTDQVTLTVGARHSSDEKTDQGGVTHAFWWGNQAWYNDGHTPEGVRSHQSDNLTFDMGNSAPLGTVMPASAPNFVDADWEETTYRLGAQYFIDDRQMLFASYATGYKMGGMYEMADTCANGCLELLRFDPEYVGTFEFGYKGTLFDNRLRLSATAFYSDYEDMHNTGVKVVGVNENLNSANFGEPVTAWTTDNLTQAEIKGLELEFDALVGESGRFSGFAAWLDTSIAEDGVYTDSYACAERAIYGQALCGERENGHSIVGNELPFAPGLSMTLNYEHTFAMNSGFTLVPFVSVRWQDDMWLDVLNYDGEHLSQKQEAYLKLDASLRLTSPDDSYYVELSASNITNEDTKNFHSFNQGMVKGSYDLPRLYALRLGYQF